MAMPTSAEMTLFDADLMLAGRVGARAVEVALEHELAAPAGQQAVQTRQIARGVHCASESIVLCRGCVRDESQREPRQHQDSCDHTVVCLKSGVDFTAKGEAIMVDRRTFLAAAIGSAAVRAVAHAQGQQQISPVPTPRDWSDGADRLSRSRHRRARSALPPLHRRQHARSSGCTSARCGPKGRRGTAWAVTWCGATSRTTSRCAGSRTTAA